MRPGSRLEVARIVVIYLALAILIVFLGVALLTDKPKFLHTHSQGRQ